MKKYLPFLNMCIHIVFMLILAVINIEGTQRLLYGDRNTKEETQENPIEFASVMELLPESHELKMNRKVKKAAYLTFDDGPSDNTDRILDILKKKGVKATFFVVGKTGQKAEERYRRIVEEGHTLGLHSYSHRYEEIYDSLDHFKEDVLKLRDYLYEVTGERTWVYRFPGGSSNSVAKISIHECIDFLKEEGIVHYDWNASSEDAVSTGVSCSVLNSNVLKDALRFQQPVILMHDLHECNNTAEGLEALIDQLKEEGYEICPIEKDTRPVQHVK